MGELYTCEEVSKIYKVKPLTIWEWIKKKKLPAIKIGKEYRVRKEDLERFEQERMTV